MSDQGIFFRCVILETEQERVRVRQYRDSGFEETWIDRAAIIDRNSIGLTVTKEQSKKYLNKFLPG